jgi:LmbE family N-acetylglucosaminyl deacetylase
LRSRPSLRRLPRSQHEGRRVVVVVLTDGRALLKRFGVTSNPSPAEVSKLRKDETIRGVEILGGRAADIRFLDFENERLVEQKAEALARITALLSELAPGEVYFPSPFEGHTSGISPPRNRFWSSREPSTPIAVLTPPARSAHDA